MPQNIPPAVFASERGSRLPCWLLLLLVLPLTCGCVHRRMTIRSDPPGAQVLLEGEPIGFAPTSTNFDYYATREITLVKDGYETLTTLQKVRTPWYQRFPLDFISDNLLPFRVTNRHEFTYKLHRKDEEKDRRTQDILDRANTLRQDAQLGTE